MGKVSASSKSNNREFLEFFSEKQASDGLMAAALRNSIIVPVG
jgi:hypothetical protein